MLETIRFGPRRRVEYCSTATVSALDATSVAAGLKIGRLLADIRAQFDGARVPKRPGAAYREARVSLPSRTRSSQFGQTRTVSRFGGANTRTYVSVTNPSQLLHSAISPRTPPSV